MTPAIAYHSGIWINSRYAGRCSCGYEFCRGESVLYVPVRRRAVCRSCGGKRRVIGFVTIPAAGRL